MAKLTPAEQDNYLKLSQAVLDAVGEATPEETFAGRFNIELRGAFVASVVLERSFNGADFVPCTNFGEPVIFTGPISEMAQNYEANVLFRLRVLTWSSGTIHARISQ